MGVHLYRLTAMSRQRIQNSGAVMLLFFAICLSCVMLSGPVQIPKRPTSTTTQQLRQKLIGTWHFQTKAKDNTMREWNLVFNSKGHATLFRKYTPAEDPCKGKSYGCKDIGLGTRIGWTATEGCYRVLSPKKVAIEFPRTDRTRIHCGEGADNYRVGFKEDKLLLYYYPGLPGAEPFDGVMMEPGSTVFSRE